LGHAAMFGDDQAAAICLLVVPCLVTIRATLRNACIHGLTVGWTCARAREHAPVLTFSSAGAGCAPVPPPIQPLNRKSSWSLVSYTTTRRGPGELSPFFPKRPRQLFFFCLLVSSLRRLGSATFRTCSARRDFQCFRENGSFHEIRFQIFSFLELGG
jgi:hypothetical protein